MTQVCLRWPITTSTLRSVLGRWQTHSAAWLSVCSVSKPHRCLFLERNSVIRIHVFLLAKESTRFVLDPCAADEMRYKADIRADYPPSRKCSLKRYGLAHARGWSDFRVRNSPCAHLQAGNSSCRYTYYCMNVNESVGVTPVNSHSGKTHYPPDHWIKMMYSSSCSVLMATSLEIWRRGEGTSSSTNVNFRYTKLVKWTNSCFRSVSMLEKCDD